MLEYTTGVVRAFVSQGTPPLAVQVCHAAAASVAAAAAASRCHAATAAARERRPEYRGGCGDWPDSLRRGCCRVGNEVSTGLGGAPTPPYTPMHSSLCCNTSLYTKVGNEISNGFLWEERGQPCGMGGRLGCAGDVLGDAIDGARAVVEAVVEVIVEAVEVVVDVVVELVDVAEVAEVVDVVVVVELIEVVEVVKVV